MGMFQEPNTFPQGIEPKNLTTLIYQYKNMIGQEQSMVREEIPKDNHKLLGIRVISTTFIDANILHDCGTGESVTAVSHFINTTPIDWYSKRQTTMEAATYGSEFVAARTATEQVMDL